MASLMLLAWSSILAALGHRGHHNSKLEFVSYFGLQLICMVTGALEVGTIESGKPVKGLRVGRYSAAVAGAWYMILLICLSWNES